MSIDRNFLVHLGVFTGFVLTGNWLGAIAIAGSYIDSKLQPKGLGQEGLQLNITSNEAALPVVYGRAKIGIKVVDIRLDSSDNKSLAVVGALCIASEAGGGVSAIEKVWFDEVLAIDGATFEGEPRNTNIQSPWKTGTTYGTDLWLQYGAHAGTDAQVVDSELDTQVGYDANDKAGGVAYLALWLFQNEEIFTTGLPNVTALIKGNLVFDPRDSSTAWSDNPVLHIWDWLTSNKYGLRLPASALNNQSFIDAANYADELVTIPGATTHKRFLGGGAFPTDGDPIDVLKQLLSGCRAELVPVGAEYKIVIRQSTTAETFELNEDNIIGGWEFFRGGTREIPNQISVSYVDPDLNYQPNTVLYPEPGAANGFLTADNNYLNQHHIELPLTDDEYRAQQIGQTLLKELREDAGCVVTANREALKLEPGDVVKLTHPTPGWTSKEFWVIALAITQDHNVRLLLREYDVTVYTLDPLNTKDTPPGTDLPDPTSVIAPTGFTATSGAGNALNTQDGLIVPRVLLTWTKSTDPFLKHYEIRHKRSGDSDWSPNALAQKDDVQMYVWPLDNGVLYDFNIRAVNTFGVKGTQITAQNTVTTSELPATSTVFVHLDDKKIRVKRATGFNHGSMRVVVQDTQPTEANTRAAGSTSLVDHIAFTFTVNDWKWVGVFLYSDASGADNESEHHTFRIKYEVAPIIGTDFQFNQDPTDTLKMTVDVEDLSLSVTAIAFNKRSEDGARSGFVTTWDSTTGTIGASTTLQRVESVAATPGKDAEIGWRVTWTDADGASQIEEDWSEAVHMEAQTKLLRIPHTDFRVQDETDTFEHSANRVLPRNVGTQTNFYASFVVPKGVTITEIEAQMFRAAVGDLAVCVFHRGSPTADTTNQLATLTHTGTGYSTKSATLSELVADDLYLFEYRGTCTVTAFDSRFKWAEITYTVPSAVKNTY